MLYHRGRKGENMKKYIAFILISAMLLISCKTVEPTQEPVSMDATWYVMTEENILMLCETDDNQTEYIEAIKLLQGDSNSVKAAIEKLKSMEQTAETQNAIGIGYLCFAKHEEAEEYLKLAFEMAKEDSQKICIINNQILCYQGVDRDIFSESAINKYNSLAEIEILDPIQNLVLRSNLLFLDLRKEAKGKAIEKPADVGIAAMEELISKEKELLGSNQMIGMLNYIVLASLYIDSGIDIQKGIDYLNTVLTLNEEHYQYTTMDMAAYRNLADAYLERKEYDQAIEFRSKRIELGESFYIEGHPNLQQAYLLKGGTLYKAERYDEAIVCYEDLIKQFEPDSTDSGTIRYNLGLAYFKKGEMEKAIEYFTTAYHILSRDEENQQFTNNAKYKLQEIYDEGGYSENSPDFDIWMEEQIAEYGNDNIEKDNVENDNIENDNIEKE